MSEEDRMAVPKLAKLLLGLLDGFFCAVLIACIAALTYPIFITRLQRNPHKADITQTISNLRQVGLAHLKFVNDFGEHPNENTVALIAKKHPKHGYDLSGKSSNALFRQLFAAGITESEGMFYAKVQGVRKPDGNTAPGMLLEKGEVGFAYIAGLSPDGNPARLLALAPVIPGTTRFDPKPFGGKAIVLRMDYSVTSVNIGKDGHVRIGGFDLLSPENPIWNSKVIDIRYPE